MGSEGSPDSGFLDSFLGKTSLKLRSQHHEPYQRVSIGLPGRHVSTWKFHLMLKMTTYVPDARPWSSGVCTTMGTVIRSLKVIEIPSDIRFSSFSKVRDDDPKLCAVISSRVAISWRPRYEPRKVDNIWILDGSPNKRRISNNREFYMLG